MPKVSDPLAIQRTDIDGIPVFWRPVDGPRMGALQFGVGRHHEPAARGGISHLVEHLALAPLRQPDFSHTGTVHGIRTIFQAMGSDEQVVQFFAAVCAGLTRLPIDRLGMERRVLRHEARDARPGPDAVLAWYRFGPAGAGTLLVPELGLNWLGPEPIEAWAQSMFTAQNAAAWLSGPPPAGLRLPLPNGARPAAPPTEPIRGIELPTHVAAWDAAVGMSWVIERSVAAVVLLALAQRRAREVLRFERGLIYDIKAWYEPLDATVTHCVLAAESAASDRPAVANQMLDALESLARDGPTPAELTSQVRSVLEAANAPQAVVSHLDRSAFDHLLGLPFETPAELNAEYRDLRPADVRTAAALAADSLMLVTAGSPPRPHLRPYPLVSSLVIQGRRHAPPGFAPPWQRRPELVVGSDGIMQIPVNGPAMAIRFADVVALRHYEGGIRELWSRDGIMMRVGESEWGDGEAVVRAIDDAMDPAVVACDEHGLGAYEDPQDRVSDV